MSQAYKDNVEESNNRYETQVQQTQQTARTHQSTQIGFMPFFFIWVAVALTIIIVTITLIIKNKRKQAKAREEYKKYDEEMIRAQKENSKAINNDIREQTANEFKAGISDIIDDI